MIAPATSTAAAGSPPTAWNAWRRSAASTTARSATAGADPGSGPSPVSRARALRRPARFRHRAPLARSPRRPPGTEPGRHPAGTSPTDRGPRRRVDAETLGDRCQSGPVAGERSLRFVQPHDDAARPGQPCGVVVRLDEPEAAFPDDWAALAPVAKGLGVDPAVWVLTGGEDHGLLATFPPGAVPAPFQVVGEVSAPAEHGAGTVLVGGALWHGSPGWDHFRAQPRR